MGNCFSGKKKNEQQKVTDNNVNVEQKNLDRYFEIKNKTSEVNKRPKAKDVKSKKTERETQTKEELKKAEEKKAEELKKAEEESEKERLEKKKLRAENNKKIFVARKPIAIDWNKIKINKIDESDEEQEKEDELLQRTQNERELRETKRERELRLIEDERKRKYRVHLARMKLIIMKQEKLEENTDIELKRLGDEEHELIEKKKSIKTDDSELPNENHQVSVTNLDNEPMEKGDLEDLHEFMNEKSYEVLMEKLFKLKEKEIMESEEFGYNTFQMNLVEHKRRLILDHARQTVSFNKDIKTEKEDWKQTLFQFKEREENLDKELEEEEYLERQNIRNHFLQLREEYREKDVKRVSNFATFDDQLGWIPKA